MRECNGKRMHTRVKGRPVLLTALMRLRLRVQRFGTKRATRREDVLWAQQVGDALDRALDAARASDMRPGVGQVLSVKESGRRPAIRR
jgi:hypothetical protein